MIRRLFSERLSQLLARFPVVSVLGPRQCGKTTFIRSALPRWRYLDMEKPSDAAFLSADPERALIQLKERFILDEAQEMPSLFSVLRSYIDSRRRRRGQMVLLGSASPSLIGHISESLAGRTGFLEMTPFQWEEVATRRNVSRDDLWLRGGFPEAFLAAGASARLDWFDGFTRTFIERDLTALGIEVSAPQMRRLWTMLAHVNGGLWNASQLAASLGTSYHTVNRYADILEKTFLIRRLQPYFANVGKRIVKSPKIYFRDSGLLHYFLNIRDRRTLESHPARGGSWEAFVLEQFLGALRRKSPHVQSYFWRTSAGAEVDLLIQNKNKLIPFEIKLHSSPGKEMTHGLRACMADLKLSEGYLLYPGQRQYSLGHRITALPVESALSASLFSARKTAGKGLDVRALKRGPPSNRE